MKGTPTVYLFIGRKAEKQLVTDFVKIARETLSIFVPEGIPTFTKSDAISFFEVGKTRAFNIVIDEFQRVL